MSPLSEFDVALMWLRAAWHNTLGVLEPRFNTPSTTIPFVFVSQPSEHTHPSTLNDCWRCQWAVRRGALAAHVMMRSPDATGQTMYYTKAKGSLPTAKYVPED